VAYVALALVGLTVAGFAMAQRTTFEARALRARGMPYTIVEDGDSNRPDGRAGARIRNIFSIRVQNKTDQERTYFLEVASAEVGEEEGQRGGEKEEEKGQDLDDEIARAEIIVSQPRVRLGGLADIQVPIVATLDQAAYEEPFPISMAVTDSTSGERKTVEVKFQGP
jgi:hypothetical protein